MRSENPPLEEGKNDRGVTKREGVKKNGEQ